jgi:leucine dehydrogenase
LININNTSNIVKFFRWLFINKKNMEGNLMLENALSPSSIDNSLINYAKTLGFGDLHIKIDEPTGLIAIVAVHSLKLGPAIGGCRCLPYTSLEDAIKDVMRLARGMSLKAAACNLPHGGAKAVIIRPAHIANRKAFFEAFGDFVHRLKGDYITAVDSGTTLEDMDIIASRTPYVTSTSDQGDPSRYTALGVRRGIEAAVQFKLNRSDMSNVHVAIQGAGHVGYYLAKELHALGAKLTMSDVNQAALLRCVNEFGVDTVPPEKIYEVACDVFAPCALGGIINQETIKKLNTPIVAGAANNQLQQPEDGVLLHEKGILYAPDFVINAGGLLQVAAFYDNKDRDNAYQQIYNLYDILLDLFKRAAKENLPTSEIAELIAMEKLK